MAARFELDNVNVYSFRCPAPGRHARVNWMLASAVHNVGALFEELQRRNVGFELVRDRVVCRLQPDDGWPTSRLL